MMGHILRRQRHGFKRTLLAASGCSQAALLWPWPREQLAVAAQHVLAARLVQAIARGVAALRLGAQLLALGGRSEQARLAGWPGGRAPPGAT
jgi:hypothetical protein